MPVINLYAGTITLSGATAVYDWDAINGANAGLQAGPIIGIRIYNASTTDVVYVYVDGVHWQGPGSSVTKADGCTDPADHGEPIQPGQTVQYWASGGGSRPGSGLINQVYAQGTDDETITWSVIAR